MKSEGVSFRHAVELLRSGAELSGNSWAGKTAKQSTVKKLAAPVKLDAGEHESVWDGRGEDGESLPSGVYFYRLRAGGVSRSAKMTLLR